MTMIRLSGSQLHAARVLVGLSLEELAERARLCRLSIRKWETSSHAIPGAMYPHLCRVVDILEGEGVRFTGDGVSTLSGDLLLSNGRGTSRHQLRTIARAYGMDLAARVRHGKIKHRVGVVRCSLERTPQTIDCGFRATLLARRISARGRTQRRFGFELSTSSPKHVPKVERRRRIRRIAITASRGHGSNCGLNLRLPRGPDHPGIPAFRSPSLRRSNCCRYFSVVSFSGTGARLRKLPTVTSG